MSNLDFECQVSEIYLKYVLRLHLMCPGRLASQGVNAAVAAGVSALARSLTVLMSRTFSTPCPRCSAFFVCYC